MRTKNFTITVRQIVLLFSFGIITIYSAEILAQPTQKLITNRLEHTGTIAGMTKYAVYEDDQVFSENGERLFYNGYSGAVQMAGLKANGSLKVCAIYYEPHTAFKDYYTGLLNDSNGEIVSGSEVFYNRIWKINDFQIAEILTLKAAGSLQVDDLPEDIKTWPGKGNPFVNAEFVSSDVAPFYDSDDDDIYNPLLGDYPLVSSKRGAFVPSEFTFTIYHDQGIHGVSGSQPMNMQFYQTQYVINCKDGDLDRTVFTIIKTKSFDESAYEKAYIGLYVDNHLGCDRFDRFGYDKITNSIFNYEKGGYDTSPCLTDYTAIDSSFSVVKSMIFNDTLSSLINVKDFQPIGDPVDPYIYIYNRLIGKYDGGDALTYGGDGFNPGSTDSVQYVFPDFPNNPDGWSAETADLPDTDFRIQPSICLDKINPGEIIQIEYSELVMVSEMEKGFDLFNSYRDRVAGMQSSHLDYINGESLCPSPLAVIHQVIENQLIIYPNPASGYLNFECFNCTGITEINLISVEGMSTINIGDVNKQNIDVRKLSAGLYFLRVETESKVIIEKVLLK